MKSFKLLIFILVILGLLNYLSFLLIDNHIYALKIGFPLTIYYEFIIDGDTQFSYYPENIMKYYYRCYYICSNKIIL